MFLTHHYQNAYVTPDIDRAVEILRSQYEVQDVAVFEATTEVWTPHGSGPATNKLAFAWVGKLQLELIQPVSGPSPIYSEAVSPDQPLRFHHIAMRVEGDWDAFRAQVDREQRKVAYAGEGQGLKFLYVDARETLGHYLEYVWAVPETWARLDPAGVTSA